MDYKDGVLTLEYDMNFTELGLENIESFENGERFFFWDLWTRGTGRK